MKNQGIENVFMYLSESRIYILSVPQQCLCLRERIVVCFNSWSEIERKKQRIYWRERIVDMCVCNVSGIHQTKQWIVGEILKVSHSKILCLSSSNCCKWDYLIWCCNFLPPFTSQLQLMKLQPLEGHIDLKVVKLLICLEPRL